MYPNLTVKEASGLFFDYGEEETTYLKARDARLAEVIEKVGHIDRAVDADLFSSVVHHIIGQQISTKAQQTIWQRMNGTLGAVTPETVSNADIATLQALGTTFRKAEYIKDFSEKIVSGAFDLAAIEQMASSKECQVLRQL